MATTLSQASALNPGSDLWVCSDLESSKWTAKLDWYLNFQIAKACRRRSPEISSFLRETILETGMEIISPKAHENSALLIQSGFLLPNKWVMMLPYLGDMNLWLEEIVVNCQNLQKPSVRIFLPTGQSASSIDQLQLTPDKTGDLTLVLDLSH